ncbi:MAG: phytoene/squalene synthase family protein [Candidatus Caldarchaeum sp.]|uniref:Phytoene/squalene synthase family protein n=1 Tax=Caldiarchaeum subterraneum TaxID=311458 RepID=A0A7C4I5Q8_CALS0|nr:phytoene/squalene synthase family protein [Candidatus Caldarchaeales archaeon]MDJ0272106.1 phytoene/squalene synthase family protein [Candidatus Caldarchaeales archaeon]
MLVPKPPRVQKPLFNLFQKGSTTYFNSTLFFPEDIKKDVFKLYAFLRKADNYVDIIPQDIEGFYAFREEYERAASGHQSSDIVINEFVKLSNRKKFEQEWITAFLDAMESDLYRKTYYTLDELCVYMYGSAEVVGLFMAKILDLPEESYIYARFLGRAMQYINFIRDIREDYELGRQYLPYEELRMYGVKDFDPASFCGKQESFARFIRLQIERYFEWQRFAEKGYRYIPYRYLIPIKTAADMYKWTAKIIYKRPSLVFLRKVKPRKRRVVYGAHVNFVMALRHKIFPGGLAWP